MESDSKTSKDVIDEIDSFPKEKWCGGEIVEYDGVWYSKYAVKGVMATQRLFKAEESDIILATFPKAGTTWLKALAFSIVNRHLHKPQHSPLLTTNSHALVYFLESTLYLDGVPDHQKLDQLTTPRIFSTHIPYGKLPHSIKASNCRVVYLCRNPLDIFVSYWHFVSAILKKSASASADSPPPLMEPIEEAFAKYCEGVNPFGPVWEHILGYWKMSVENPEKVLFVKYEDLKEDAVPELKRIAAFLGCPFTEEELEQGVVEEISKQCSFGSMKDLDVNKNIGVQTHGLPESLFFRKGEVGDYANFLTPSMVQTLANLIQRKFAASDSGPVFKF